MKSLSISAPSLIPKGACTMPAASTAMSAGGRSADRRDERVWRTAVPTALTMLGLYLALHGLAPTVFLLCLALFGVSAWRSPFWALTTEWLSAHGSRGVSRTNAVGTGASFFASWATGSRPLELLSLAGVTAVATVAVILLGRRLPSVLVTSD